MTLAERLSEYVRACFTGIWVQSFEHDDAIVEIARLCRQQRWSLATWDIDRGLSIAGQDDDSNTAVSATDPLAAIRALAALATPDGTALLVLRNFHRFLGSPEVVQALDTAISAGKQNRTFVVVLAPVVQIPVELERQFVVIEHDLPGRDQLRQIARAIATEPGELPGRRGPGRRARRGGRADPVRGRERLQPLAGPPRPGRPGRAVGAQDPDAQEERPADAAPGRRDVRRPGRPGGPQGVLQAFLDPQDGQSAVAAQGRAAARRRRVRESAFCKALGNETGRPTLILDVGALMGSLVGQTEERTRQALRIADAMAPCIVVRRRDREGALRRPGQRPDRQRRLGPDVRDAA